jgi:hypothetical protein
LHLPIFINIFLNKKLIIPSKFDCRFGFSDFDKLFCYEFKIRKLIDGIFLRFLYYLFIKVIFEGLCFKPENAVFEMKHTCTF